eukprot:444828-Pyramimonas_sp.AAC.1
MRPGVWQDKDSLQDELLNAAKLLGGWVDMDGGTRTDTSKRIAAAAKAWGGIRKPLVKMKIDLKLKGRIVEAVVFAALFYAAEVRPFTYAERQRYQVCMNKVIKAIVWSVHKTTLREMEGKYMMFNLYEWCGVRAAEEYIALKTIQYLGHLGRYSDERLERRMLGAKFECLDDVEAKS